ncbi:MAG: hypothetical protein OXU24_15015 [Gammaproteobacteria bacterium]|nr:hypothetical protein [Gammaproteobacteria bacterium]
MQKKTTIILAAPIAILASASLFQYQENRNLELQLLQDSALSVQLLERAEAHTLERLALQHQIQSLENNLAGATAQISNLSTELQAARENSTVDIEQVRAGLSSQSELRRQRQPAPRLVAELQRAMARTSTLDAYAEFLDEHVTDDDRRNQIIELLVEITLEHDQIVNELSQQERMAYYNEPDARDQFMIDNLSQHLSTVEAIAFSQYVADTEERVFRKHTAANVLTAAPGLADASRKIVVESLYFELMENWSNTGRPAPTEYIAITQWEEAAMERARNALRDQLSPDDFDEANKYFEQQVNRLIMSREIWRAQRAAAQ